MSKVQSYAEQQNAVLVSKLANQQQRVHQLEQELRDTQVALQEAQLLYERLEHLVGNIAEAYLHVFNTWRTSAAADSPAMGAAMAEFRTVMHERLPERDYD